VIDHDRTRSPVGPGIDRLARIVAGEPYGIDATQMRAAQASIEADGMSFDPLRFIVQEFDRREDGDALFKRLKADYASGDPAELSYPDTAGFEARLQLPPAIPHLVVTAGVNAQWQAMKIAGSGYAGYSHIMEVGPSLRTPPKGPIIASWQDGEGRFPLVAQDADGKPVAIISAGTAYLIDDKASSFSGRPAGSGGAYIIRQAAGERHVPSQGLAADLPAGIDVVHSLSEIKPEHRYQPETGLHSIGRQFAKFTPLATYPAG
jgi:hypothetical protein